MLERHPIDTVPRDGKTWVLAWMPAKQSPSGWWACSAVFREDADHWTDGASVMHYNGSALVTGFRGPFTHWSPLKPSDLEPDNG